MEKAVIMYRDVSNNKLKEKRYLYDYRRKMVEYYITGHSYRETGKVFGVSKNTVMKWVKRYKENGLEGLRDKKRAPKRVWNKTRKEVEDVIIKLREQSHFGPRRLKEEFKVGVSVGSIYRILKEAGLIKKRRKKYKEKRDLREIKEKLKVFERIQVDIKYLDDIPEFYPYYLRFNLPRYQITAREVRSGALYYFYTNEKSVTATIIAMKILLEHLRKYGIKTEDITIQTDNGSEFSGGRMHHDRGFVYYLREVEKTNHIFIPPRYPNANADVESSHKLIEYEFYKVETIRDRDDFLNKAFTYQVYFNLMRKNSNKGWKTPKDIIKEYGIPEEILILPGKVQAHGGTRLRISKKKKTI